MSFFDDVSDTVSKAADIVAGVASAAADGVARIVDKARDVGNRVVDWLVDKAKAVGQAISNAASKVFNAVKDHFFPSSPEKVVKKCRKIPIPKGCEYLQKGDTVEAPQANFDRIRKKATIGPEKKVKHKFPGDTADVDAISQTVTIDGRNVEVVRPEKSVAPKNLPSVDQMAKALGAVPSKQLDKINTVELSDQQNPDDAYWAKEYKDPNFYSAATGGPGGVTFYPKDTAWKQAFCDSTAIHEGGHAFSGELWKNPKTEEAWKAAIAADEDSPSKYADNAPTEDFSESLVMYSLSKGTPCESTARDLYPHRYAELDKLLK